MRFGPQTRVFEEQRPRLLGLAYRMLGSMVEAEDTVQEAWFRFRRATLAELDSPASWLATIVSRLCLDRLRHRKIEKLNYTGPWLPEPIPTETDPAVASETMDSITYGFMFLLEYLTPLERGVIILREAFDLSHDDIATRLGIEAAHSRQLLRRARQRLQDLDPGDDGTPEPAGPLVERFLEAAEHGDPSILEEVLRDDVESWSDGGGKVSAALIPLIGRNKVTTVHSHLLRHMPADLTFEAMTVNGDTGIVARSPHGIYFVMALDVRGGRVRRMFTMRNPDKVRQFVAAGSAE